MQFKKINIKKVEGKDKDHYDLELTTYKESIVGRFQTSQLRHLVQIIDNELVP